MTPLSARKIEGLRDKLKGEVLLANDDAYEDARKIWNATIDKRPGMIVRCSTTSDVVHAVSFARDSGDKIAAPTLVSFESEWRNSSFFVGASLPTRSPSSRSGQLRIIRMLAFCASCLSSLAACGSPVDSSAQGDGSVAESRMEQPTSALEPPTAGAASAESAAMMVFVDPESGMRVSRPITEAQRQLARSAHAGLNRSSEGLEVVRRPDGSIVVELQGRFQHTAVARRGPDGTVHLDCDTDAEPVGHGAAPNSAAPSTAPLE